MDSAVKRKTSKVKKSHGAPHTKTKGTREIPDATKKKKFSSGVQATIRSVRKFWLAKPEDGPERTVKSFVAEFGKTFERVAQAYPGVHENSKDGIEGVVERLELQHRDIDFRDMRALAEFVDLPTGLFLLFTQCVADAKRGETPTEVAAFVRKSGEALEALARFVEHSEMGANSLFEFLPERTGGMEYKAHIDGLMVMSRAFAPEKYKK